MKSRLEGSYTSKRVYVVQLFPLLKQTKYRKIKRKKLQKTKQIKYFAFQNEVFKNNVQKAGLSLWPYPFCKIRQLRKLFVQTFSNTEQAWSKDTRIALSSRKTIHVAWIV